MHEMRIEVRTNIHHILSKMFDLETKCATIEGGNVATSECPPELRQDLYRCCKEIEQHLKKHAIISLSSANFYFKVDPKNQIHLIFVTCVKADKLHICLNGHRKVILGVAAQNNT